MTTTRTSHFFYTATPNIRGTRNRIEVRVYETGVRTLRTDYRGLRKYGVPASVARGVLLRTMVVSEYVGICD